ncbi:hypothetical protein MVEG_05819 [Podila verticillata NRRL 6337]|nr:hypothetical protein MVEG_05819 [Podila verticillata NRRL 6337]
MAANKAGWKCFSRPHGITHSDDEGQDSGVDDDGDDEASPQYRGLVPARKLYTLETVLDAIQDQDLAFLLDHEERTMQVLCVPTSKAGVLIIKALKRRLELQHELFACACSHTELFSATRLRCGWPAWRRHHAQVQGAFQKLAELTQLEYLGL